jgi:TonB-dependent starch-binding outer membrane protein SusC
VVVTGYTTENKRQTTAAVSIVKARDLTAIPSGNVEQQLQGRVSGLTVITNGQPGTSSIVRVRGFGAFGGNEPLYIVDGVPVTSTDFLSPDDIETTTVLKDAAAASIYGARAANGVIVYTTKRGKKGDKKVNISYDGLYGATDPGKSPGFLTPQEYADWTWQAYKNTGQPLSHPQFGTGATPVLPDYLLVGALSGVSASAVNLTTEQAKYNNDSRNGNVYLVMPSNKAGTDWYAAITRQAPIQRHNLGFSGASENSRYYIGLGTQQQDGIVKQNSFTRYDLRANSEFDLTSFLRVGQNLQLTYRSILGQSGASNGGGIAESESIILAAFRMPTIIPVNDAFGGYAGSQAKGFNNVRNPLGTLSRIADDRSYNMSTFGNVYVELDVVPGLTLRSSIGGQYNNYYGIGFAKPSYEHSENIGSFAYSEFSGYRYNWVNTNTARYVKAFGKHNIDLLGGIEALNDNRGRDMIGSGQDPFSRDVNFVTLSTAVTSRQVTSNLELGSNYFSTFGRVNYTYGDKYFFTAIMRRDGSSRFGATQRQGVFPALSAAWRVTGEDFLKSTDFLTDLKVRVGWGQMGNDKNTRPTNQYTLYSGALDQGSYPITGSNTAAAAGFFQSTIGNPDAKWETSETANIGFDASILKGKFEIAVDLWRKNTKDLLFQKPLPAVGSVVAAAPFINIATMLNQGIDIQVNNKGKIAGDFRYEATVIGSWLHNEITSLADEVKYFDVNPPINRLGGAPVRNQLGQSVSAFFGYQVKGLFQSKSEVDGAPKQDGAGVGRFRFADLNSKDAKGNVVLGVPDNKIDDADRTFIGSPVPKFTGGLNFEVKYKDFGLATYMYTSLGNKIYNQSKWYTDFYSSFTGSNLSNRIKDSWSTTNTGSSIPIIENVSNFSTNTQSNSYYVEDGSYLRMQNLAFSYTVPTKYLKNVVKRLRASVAVNNVFTLTKYQGLDPAVGGAADTLFGIDLGNYPVTRSVMFTLSAGF